MVNNNEEEEITAISAGVIPPTGDMAGEIPPPGDSAIVSPQKQKAVVKDKEEEQVEPEKEKTLPEAAAVEKNSNVAPLSMSDAIKAGVGMKAAAAAAAAALTSLSDSEAAAAAAAKAIVVAAAAEPESSSDRLRRFNEKQEEEAKEYVKLKQAALAEFQRKEALEAEKLALAQQVVQAQTDPSQPADEIEELKLSDAERALLNFNGDVTPHLASPVPESVEGIPPTQLQGWLATASQKYCIALYLNENIHLLHSAFMIGEEVYACTSKGGINGEQYVKFHYSEFCNPMKGLFDPAVFAGQADLVNKIPTTVDLLTATDPDSFLKGLPSLEEVHLSVASLTARPSSMILLSGELYFSLVTSFCIPAEEYGFRCGAVDAVHHIRNVAIAEDRPERYDPFLYFLVATTQGFNPSKSELVEVPTEVITEEMRQQLIIRQRSFLKFQLATMVEEEEVASPSTVSGATTTPAVTFPSGIPEMTTPSAGGSPPVSTGVATFNTGVATSSVSQLTSVSFDPSTKGGSTRRGRNFPTRIQRRALQYTSRSLRQLPPRVPSSLRTTQTRGRSPYAQSRIRLPSLPPPPPSPAASLQPVVPPTTGLMSALQSQQFQTNVLMSLAQAQAEHVRRVDDHNEQSLNRLLRLDERKTSRESQLAGQTLEQRYLLQAALTPDDVYEETPVFEFKYLVFSETMKTLVEAKNPNHVLNQIRQITRHFHCAPNKSLFFQFLRTQGCLPAGGIPIGGMTVFLMVPGFTIQTAKEFYLQHDINMREGEESSYEEFRSLLGKANVVPPQNESEGLHMLEAMVDFMEKMAGGPCMASTGYELAAELYEQYAEQIYQLCRSPTESNFLLRLLSAIDQEVHIMFRSLFRDIEQVGTGQYKFRKDLTVTRDKKITEIFADLERGRTYNLRLPDQFLTMLESNQSKRGRGGGGGGGGGDGGGGGGGDPYPPRKKPKGKRTDQSRPSRDFWSGPETDEDPVATYFSVGKGKDCRDRWMKIKFKHHCKQQGKDQFGQSPLCLQFHVNGFCEKGFQCEFNHRRRAKLLLEEKSKKKVMEIDEIVKSTSL